MIKRFYPLALLALAACGSTPQPGDACATNDNVVCGQANGTSVALLCTPGASGSQQQYLTNCSTCDHVENCKTEVVCNGVNVANADLHCDIQGAAVCDVHNNAHILKCGTDNVWALSRDCSTMGKSCGMSGPNMIGCI